MCGRVIQSGGPLRYAIVDGMNVRDSRVHNYPPRWNAAPSQDLLVIRRNHKTGEVSLDPLRWGLIPYWCKDPRGGRKPITGTCRPAELTLDVVDELLDAAGRRIGPLRLRACQVVRGFAIHEPRFETAVHRQHENDQADEVCDVLAEQAPSAPPLCAPLPPASEFLWRPAGPVAPLRLRPSPGEGPALDAIDRSRRGPSLAFASRERGL